jgi:hypothetical protein
MLEERRKAKIIEIKRIERKKSTNNQREESITDLYLFPVVVAGHGLPQEHCKLRLVLPRGACRRTGGGGAA